MKKASLLSILLLIAILIGALSSCSDVTVNPEDTTDPAAVTSVADTEPVETEDPDYSADLPASLNYGNAEIKVISSARDWWADEVTVEGINGELINDTVYNRNLRVEERLGVKIKNIQIEYTADDHITVAIKKAFTSGDSDLYDVCFGNSFQMCMASVEGYFCDLNKVENINLTKKYWLEGYNDAISFHGAQFTATGAISLSTMRFVFVTFFNKAIFENSNIESPYKTVSDGKWTLEYQQQIIKTLYIDTDGNQTASDGDRFGLVSGTNINMDPYWASLELQYMVKNSDGDYVLDPNTDKMTAAVDKILLVLKEQGTKIIKSQTGDAEQATLVKLFTDGEAAMAQIRLKEIETEEFRTMTDKYGIAPVPKYDENQENYHSLMHDQFTVVSVLSTVPASSRGMMGAFLEAMAYQSYKETMPAYYELSLKTKYQSDPESWEILDKMMEDRVIHAGILYYTISGSPQSVLRGVATSLNNTIASSMKALNKTASKSIKKLNESLTALVDKN